MYETTSLLFPKTAELRTGDGDGRMVVTGLAVPWRQLADLGKFSERFFPHAFGASIAGDVWCDIEHNRAALVARSKNGSLRLTDNDDGLFVRVILPPTTRGVDLGEEIRTGLVDGLSVMFDNADSSFSDSGGRQIRTITKARLLSIAFTGSPSYKQTAGSLALSVDQVEAGDLLHRRRLLLAAAMEDG